MGMKVTSKGKRAAEIFGQSMGQERMTGIYVGRIFLEVKGRPLCFVDQTCGCDQAVKEWTPAVTPWRQLRNTADVRALN
jgi:hypothetical protein